MWIGIDISARLEISRVGLNKDLLQGASGFGCPVRADFSACHFGKKGTWQYIIDRSAFRNQPSHLRTFLRNRVERGYLCYLSPFKTLKRRLALTVLAINHNFRRSRRVLATLGGVQFLIMKFRT